jgi:uncharacterized protein YbjT (DUF2867 family)
MSEIDREFDIVLWGATGFTGQLVARYLLERYGVDGSSSAPTPATARSSSGPAPVVARITATSPESSIGFAA